MVSELLEHSNGNVFVVDWSEASKPPYNQAVENLELIAAYCANLMTMIQVSSSTVFEIKNTNKSCRILLFKYNYRKLMALK